MATERGRDLYDKIVREGERAIDELIQTRESEAYFVDFKRSSDNGSGPNLSQPDRTNLAKAISGFGNSEGGVVIWGVSTASGQNDVAQANVMVQDAAAFRARLEGAVSGCTVPAHDGVVSHAIAAPGTAQGFVVTYVPKSHRAPHQTVPELRYLMRAGSAFLPVPHAVLSGMFGRRPHPNVFPNFTLAVPEMAPGRVKVSCGIAVYNEGPGVARDAFAVATVLSLPGPNCAAVFETPNANWEGHMGFGVRVSLVTKEGHRIPPQTHVQPLILHVTFAPPFEDALKLTTLVGSDGGAPFESTWENSPADIAAVFERLVRGEFADLHEASQALLGTPLA